MKKVVFLGLALLVGCGGALPTGTVTITGDMGTNGQPNPPAPPPPATHPLDGDWILALTVSGPSGGQGTACATFNDGAMKKWRPACGDNILLNDVGVAKENGQYTFAVTYQQTILGFKLTQTTSGYDVLVKDLSSGDLGAGTMQKLQ